MAYTRRAMEMFFQYLPADRATAIAKRARYTYARAALRSAREMSDQGDFLALSAQLREAVLLSWSPGILGRASWLMLKLGLRSAKIN
jgi:hypothetical protein